MDLVTQRFIDISRTRRQTDRASHYLWFSGGVYPEKVETSASQFYLCLPCHPIDYAVKMLIFLYFELKMPIFDSNTLSVSICNGVTSSSQDEKQNLMQ